MDISLVKRCFNVKKVLDQSAHSCRLELGVRQGTGTALVYELSPALLFAFFTFRGKAYQLNRNRRSYIWEINYCIQGRMEHVLSDGTLQYMGNGDLMFTLESAHTPEMVLPTGFYHGVGVVMDWKNGQAFDGLCPGQMGFDIPGLIQKFQPYGKDLFLSLKSGMESFYQIPEFLSEKDTVLWLGFKVKELLFYLDRCPLEKVQHKTIYKRQQIEIIKEIHEELISRLDVRLNIEDLAKRHFISATSLKNIFKEVYGKPIGAYMKEYRIRTAARELKGSEAAIGQIGRSMGYQSTSKFCAAVKEIMGCTPAAYCRSRSCCLEK